MALPVNFHSPNTVSLPYPFQPRGPLLLLLIRQRSLPSTFALAIPTAWIYLLIESTDLPPGICPSSHHIGEVSPDLPADKDICTLGITVFILLFNFLHISQWKTLFS